MSEIVLLDKEDYNYMIKFLLINGIGFRANPIMAENKSFYYKIIINPEINQVEE